MCKYSRATTIDVPGLTKSKVSPDGSIASRDLGSKLVCSLLPCCLRKFADNWLLVGYCDGRLASKRYYFCRCCGSVWILKRVLQVNPMLQRSWHDT